MELRNDNFNLINKGIGLKFTGKGINDFFNNNNIYNSNGIGIQLINNQNNNREIAFVDTSNIDNNNYSKLKISLNNSSINIRNLNEINQIQSLNVNNNLFINNNIGIGSTIPKSLLDVSGRISCYDINIGGIILNKDFLINVSSSVDNINSGTLKIENGGTGVSSVNNEQLLLGKFQQSPYLIWKDDKRRLGIGLTDPLYTLDVYGGINANSYKILGTDINNIFLKPNDLILSSNECYNNCYNNSIINANNYTDKVSVDLINLFNSTNSDWTMNGNDTIYINSKVGIGTDRPLTSLHVVGDINYTGNLKKNGVIFKNFSGNYYDLSNVPKITWELSNGHLYNINDANVGIGTKVPLSKLDVNGDINYTGDIRSNGKKINIFSGNYNDLTNIPSYSKVAYSGSFYDIYEVPTIFSGNYDDLINKPEYFPTNWKTTIHNIPTYFPTEWNISIINKPKYFQTDWNTSIDNKPFTFDTNWNSNIINKPNFFPADWDTTIMNKPKTFFSDWNSNIINKPNFATVAFTGQYSNILNKPKIFSGLYRELREKPNYSKVAFTGNYNDLYNRPELFSGYFNHLKNLPVYFQTDWNSTILNKPDFSLVAYTGIYDDLINKPNILWGENNSNIYNCNLGNVGIGITNPTYKLDVRGSLNVDNAFQISGLQSILKLNSPWGLYFAEDYDTTSRILPDSSGNNRHATTSANITKTTGSGNGATGAITYISGGTTATISWPSGSIPRDFTILSLTRYTNTNNNTNRGRILQGQYTNWLHGHHFNKRGLCHYDGWKTIEQSIGNINDWLCCIGKNGGTNPNNILIHGEAKGNALGGNGNDALRINLGAHSGESSDWALGCVMIWERHLLDTEMFELNTFIQSNLTNGGSTKALFLNQFNIYFNNDVYFSNQIFINNTNISNVFATRNDFIRTSNWVINGSNIYNVNTGSIGINTSSPSSLFKLDVNGAINSSGVNITGNGGLFWSSFGSTGIGCASVNGELSSSSLVGDMIIRSQEGNRLILQNGNNAGTLFIYNNKIGIGTNNPLSLLHLHNSSQAGELKILFTDASTLSTASDGFAIYKSGNDDGNIWNYENSAIRFATSNVERMCILADGKIGIGTNAPNSLLHLHNNIPSTAEIKISMTDGSTGIGTTDGFVIYKSTSHEAYLWNYESNAIRFGTSNTERMTILADGKIGIGTTIPSSLLHLHNTSGDLKISFTDASTLTTTTDGFAIYKSANDDGNIWNYENNAIRFGTFNTERMTILADGKVGIGINNPTSLLHLHNASSSAEIKISMTDSSTGIGTTDGFAIYKGTDNNGYLWNYRNNAIKFGTSNTEKMTILNNGNIGIGITNPSSLLHLHNTSGDLKISFTDTSTGFTSNDGFAIYKSDNDNGYIWNYESNAIRIGTFNTERMTILGDGKIGIGTTNPTSLLHLHNSNASTEIKISMTDGSIGIGSTDGFAIYKGSDNNGYLWNYRNNAIRFGTNNTEKMTILNNGNVGIGTTNPQHKLDVNGTINANFLSGDGANISNLNLGNIASGSILSINRGGTGVSSFNSNQILIGSSTSTITQSPTLVWVNNKLGIGTNNPTTHLLEVNGTINATNFRGNGSNISNLNATYISSGVLPVNYGGIGTNTLTTNLILIGNGTTAIAQSPNLVWSNNCLGIGSTTPRFNLDINGSINALEIYKNGVIFSAGSKWSNHSGTNNIYYNLGSVGIGLANPSNDFKLDVGGNIRTSGSVTATTFIGSLTGNATGLSGTPSINVSSIVCTNSITTASISSHISGTNINISSINCTGSITANSFSGAFTGTATGLSGNPSISVSQINLNNNDIINGRNITAVNFYGTFNGNASTASGVPASGITNQNGMWKSTIRNGPTKLYRREVDEDTAYSVQTSWDGTYWVLNGYNPDDTFHGPVKVELANTANSLNTNNGYTIKGLTIIGNLGGSASGTMNIVLIEGYNKFYTAVTRTFTNLTLGLLCMTTAYFGSSLIIASDKRIKNNIKNLNNKNSLDKLLLLKPVYYNKIDIINDNKVNCGLIAQDVKEIIPEAISLTNDFIPNIYKVFDIKDDVIETKDDLTSILAINDIIQIINEKDVKEEFKIIEISSTHIKIDKKYNYNKCFIYGKKIDDYHTINYNYIYNLHISATQELYSKIKEYDIIIKERKIKLKEQQDKIDLLFELLANK